MSGEYSLAQKRETFVEKYKGPVQEIILKKECEFDEMWIEQGYSREVFYCQGGKTLTKQQAVNWLVEGKVAEKVAGVRMWFTGSANGPRQVLFNFSS